MAATDRAGPRLRPVRSRPDADHVDDPLPAPGRPRRAGGPGRCAGRPERHRAAAARPPSPSTPARQELVLLHQGRGVPAGTARWLAPGRLPPTTTSSSARRATTAGWRGWCRAGPSGWCSAAAGARGSAHLGVVRALEDAGVPLDVVGGTSIGSVAAFMCAMGWDHDAHGEAPALLLEAADPAADHPVGVALVRPAPHQADHRETERRSIEDLWIRFFAVSTNISQATQVVHQRGELATALRASVSLPGILPPMPRARTSSSTEDC